MATPEEREVSGQGGYSPLTPALHDFPLRWERGWSARSIGAREAPIEDVRTVLVVVGRLVPVVAEERLVALLVAPVRLGILGRLADRHLVVDRPDPARRNRMMAAAGIVIALGQEDAIAPDLVDGADMFAVRADHLHMLGHLQQQTPLRLAFVAPAAELVLEPRPVLAAIFVIVAVERRDLVAPPAVIVVVAGIGAVPAPPFALVVTRIHLATAFGFVVAEPGADFVARAFEESAIFMAIAPGRAALVATRPIVALAVIVRAAIVPVADIGEATPVRGIAAPVVALESGVARIAALAGVPARALVALRIARIAIVARP